MSRYRRLSVRKSWGAQFVPRHQCLPFGTLSASNFEVDIFGFPAGRARHRRRKLGLSPEYWIIGVEASAQRAFNVHESHGYQAPSEKPRRFNGLHWCAGEALNDLISLPYSDAWTYLLHRHLGLIFFQRPPSDSRVRAWSVACK